MSSDEEIDYMSDSFLKESVKNDIRPGLIFNRSVKRSVELSKKRKLMEDEARSKHKPAAVLESENRDEGLEKPISSDNKGFAMLTKMGFNPGSGLGAKGQGMSEPVRIELKNNKEGLGRKEALRELMEKKRKQWKESQKNGPSVLDYRASLIAKANEKNICIDLGKSQKACYMLDTKEGISEPEVKWFWPKHCLAQDDDDDDDESEEEETESENEDDSEEFSAQDKLEVLTVYLRTNYFYCIWCGVEYENEEDLKSCPGQTRDDH